MGLWRKVLGLYRKRSGVQISRRARSLSRRSVSDTALGLLRNLLWVRPNWVREHYVVSGDLSAARDVAV